MKNQELKDKISTLLDEYIKENGVFDKMNISIKTVNYSLAAEVENVGMEISVEIEL